MGAGESSGELSVDLRWVKLVDNQEASEHFARLQFT